MARLDRVKNLTGLVEMYAKNEKLRGLVHLVIVGGEIDPMRSKDREEVKEIEKMHALIDEYKLHNNFRWIRSQTNRVRNGELYRCIADTHGAFVQPALYEGFGLTVVEAMTCGLPTFATSHGGPAEIIENGVSGYHIDPYHPDEAGNVIAAFFEQYKTEPEVWSSVSEAGLQRIYSRSVLMQTEASLESWKRLQRSIGELGTWIYRQDFTQSSKLLRASPIPLENLNNLSKCEVYGHAQSKISTGG